MESTFSQHQAANEILNELFGGNSNIDKNKAKEEQEEFSQSPPTRSPVEVRQLFIGNLPFRVRWQDIKDLFRKAGNVVRADVALNHENYRSKGHGTVLFTRKEDAQKAIDMFNGYRWNGRIIEVRGDRGFVENNKQDEEEEEKVVTPEVEAEAETVDEKEKEKEEEEQKKEEKTQVQDEDAEEEEMDDCKQVFVGNLPFHCSWHDLKDLFKTCGRIIRADVVLNFEGRSRGFGTVLFHSHQDAKSAIEKYNGFEFHHRILRVHFDKFALNHQRLREQEEESFGQRQICDPASVELLRQTYAQPKTLQQLYGFSSFMPQPQPFTVPLVQQSMNFTAGYYDHSLGGGGGYQQHHSPYMAHNSYAYQPPPAHSPLFTNQAIYASNGYTPGGQWQQQSYQSFNHQPPFPQASFPPPQQPPPQQQNTTDYLSNSLNNLTLSNITTTSTYNNQQGKESAGLINNKWI